MKIALVLIAIVVKLTASPISFGSNGWPVNSYWADDPNRIWKNGTGTYKNGTLIEMKTINCEDDEVVCEDLRRCVARKLWCDGEQDCIDNSDEKNCESRCPGEQFKCMNGRCIEKDWMCDSFDDCGDNSDERNCLDSGASPCATSEYRCRRGVCIPATWLCDGTPDCPHGDDEDRCDNSTRHWFPGMGGRQGYRHGFSRRPMDWRRGHDRYGRYRQGMEYDRFATDRYGNLHYTGRPMAGYTHGSYRTGGNYRPGDYGYNPNYDMNYPGQIPYNQGGYGHGSYQPVLGEERTTWADYGPVEQNRNTETEGDAVTEKTRGYDDREDHTQRPYGREYTDSMNMMRNRNYPNRAWERDRSTTPYGNYDPYGSPYDRSSRHRAQYTQQAEDFYGPDHTEYQRRTYNGRDYLEPQTRPWSNSRGGDSHGTGYYVDEYGQQVYGNGYDDYGRRYSSPYERPLEQYGLTHPYRGPPENETGDTWRYPNIDPRYGGNYYDDRNNTYNYHKQTYTTSVTAGQKASPLYYQPQSPYYHDRRNDTHGGVSSYISNRTNGETFYDRIVTRNNRATTESYGTPSLFGLPTTAATRNQKHLFTFQGSTRVPTEGAEGLENAVTTDDDDLDSDEENLLHVDNETGGPNFDGGARGPLNPHTSAAYTSPALMSLRCTSEQFKCHDGYRCIMRTQVCDGKLDCVDHSDEKDCGDDLCRYGLFRCVSGKCIISSFQCNSTNWSGRRVAIEANDFQGYM